MSRMKLSRSSLFLSAIILILCLIITPQTVNATLTVITPSSADTQIEKWEPDKNFGLIDLLQVRSGDTDYTKRIIIKFDLSAMPSGSIILSAYLQLYYYSYSQGDPAGRTYNAYRVTEDWVEGDGPPGTKGATWNDADKFVPDPWAIPGGVWTSEDVASSIVPPATGQWMSWDVTGIVKDWIENGHSNYGFIILDPNDGVSSTDASARFYSREFTTAGLRPVLKIDWLPSAPVGGILAPIDKLYLLTPYITLAGLVLAVSTVYVIKRRKD
jgi:hypothetical protein